MRKLLTYLMKESRSQKCRQRRDSYIPGSVGTTVALP